MRKNNCFSSGAYRLLSERITRGMAEHFRKVKNLDLTKLHLSRTAGSSGPLDVRREKDPSLSTRL